MPAMSLEEIIHQLQQFKPLSVFVYGSRARSDFKEDSDFEIGVLFREADYVSRGDIAAKVSAPGVNIYPFKLEDLERGWIDTPFQVDIYLYELMSYAKTVYGEKIVEGLKPPRITTLSLVQRIAFDKGMMVAALLSERHGDEITASQGFAKTVLFATRLLMILHKQKFPAGYDEILAAADEVLDDDKYLELVRRAYDVRLKKSKVTRQNIFDGIAYLNRCVEPQLLAALRERGDVQVL